MSGSLGLYARAAAPRVDHVGAIATKAMVSTSHPLATAAALDMLRRRGSAADAYVAAAAVQVVVEPPMTTFAGGFVMKWFDGRVGQTTLTGGLFGPPAAENGDWDEAGADSARAAPVPGWLNGARAAWRHAGKLAWHELFEHALQYAREGFVVDPALWGWMYEYRLKLARFPAAQKIWYPQGHLLNVGDRLVQSELARTIEHIQRDESLEWFYAGDFARRYVDVLTADGSRLTLADMAERRDTGITESVEPIGVYRGHEIHAPNGSLIAQVLQAVEHGDLRALGHPATNPETLYRQMRLIEEAWHDGLARGAAARWDLGASSERVSGESARDIWSRAIAGQSRPYDPIQPGTNALVIADADGNVAFGTHSCSCSPFGNGHVVDGVWVPRALRLYGQPKPWPDGVTTTLLLARGGRARLAVGSPSSCCFTNILQNTMNVIEFGMSLEESVRQPLFGSARFPSRRAMVEGNFSEATFAHLKSRGMGYFRVSPLEPEMGSCHALLVDADSGRLHGVADPRRRGQAAGL